MNWLELAARMPLLCRHCLIRRIHDWTVSWQKYAFKAIGLSQTASLPARPPMQGAGYGPRHTAIENTVLAVDDNAVTCYQQSLCNAKPTCPPSRHDDWTQAA